MFVEYAKQDFTLENLEATLQSWLAANPDAILDDSAVQIIGREVTTNLRHLHRPARSRPRR